MGNGVRSGTGTADDPFVISGWDIDARTADGISLSNLRSHVVVRGNAIHDGLSSSGRYVYSGIVVQDCGNVTSEGNELFQNYDGIFLRERATALVRENRIDDARNSAIESYDSDGPILANEINRAGGAAIAWSAPAVSDRSASIRGNSVDGAQVGIHVRGGRDHVVVGNEVARATAQGIFLEATQGTSAIRDSLVERSGTGVEVAGAPSSVSTLTATRNKVGFAVDDSAR
ncbi:MAG TPA: right-handed parallel beta-helix repeat-containing protein, partial [Burkholderiales bacterium]|nr:right-handed parallel beta-helix repeat-containing protein [Burkholderiales bacterium]